MQKYRKPNTDDLGKKNPLALREDFEIATGRFFSPDAYDSNGVRKTYELEIESTAKLYTKAEFRENMNGLSLRGKEMLLWLLYTLETGQDHLWINKERYMEELQIKSINTYKAALNELIKELYLCPTTVKDVYWINPKYFFKGNRKRKYPERVRTKYNYTEEVEDSTEIEG